MSDICPGGGGLCTCPFPSPALAGRLARGEAGDGLGDEDEDGGDGEDGEDDPQDPQLPPQEIHCLHLSTLLHTGGNVWEESFNNALISPQLLPQEARRVGRLAKAILDLSLLSPW